MKQLKKTLLTLVALLAVTTGAWATDPNAVTAAEINSEIYSGWSSIDGVLIKVSELPGFQTVTEDQAKSWTGAPSTGTVELFYEFVADGQVKAVRFVNGVYDSSFMEEDLERNLIWEDIKYNDAKYFYTTGPASSGPKVDWDKDKKTGTFKMPGGNVTLEPDYYPQATAEGAVTAAAADARATTDDPLVKVDATKLTGAKKLMYFVSNSESPAPAYNAEGWTDQLPTAEKFKEAGNVYVWYYPVGTDEGQDDATATYSDGDMNATALEVNIAPEPTYAVTFAEGTDANEWKAEPATGVKKGQTVTVTYTGSKKVIGVKAEKKAAAGIVNPVVGQIIGSDGKNYDANATLPSGVTAVAKIAYVGNDAETSTTYNHGLALALGDVSDKKAWCSQYQKTCLTTQYGSADAAKGDMAGIANTDALVNHTGHSHAAASAARDYNGGTHPMGTSEWFLPSAGQWDKMASAAGGYVKLRTNAGLQSDYYWSSTERDASYAWYFSSHNGDWLKDYKDMYSHRVRACLAF